MTLRAIDRMILLRVKIEWAKKHLRDLAAESLTLQHTAVLRKDENTGVPPHPIAIFWGDIPTVPTISFNAVCLAGDVIHNLRASLDHLAFQLAILGNPNLTRDELKQIEFPIAKSFTIYESMKVIKLKGVRREAVKAIDSLKPYKGGNDALWRLHELDIIDKHRTLFTFGPEFIFTSNWFDGTYHFKTDDPHFSGIEADVEKDIKLELDEAIRQSQAEQTSALLPTLHELTEFVDKTIGSFERLLE